MVDLILRRLEIEVKDYEQNKTERNLSSSVELTSW